MNNRIKNLLSILISLIKLSEKSIDLNYFECRSKSITYCHGCEKEIWAVGSDSNSIHWIC